MTIDWVTVSAQAVNFLVLVYLLKRFLYRPVIRAMDRREQKIAARLGDADSQVEAARREKELYAAKRQELETGREALIEEAREEARGERTRALADLRDQISNKRAEWQMELQREQEALLKDVRRALSKRISAVVHRILSDLANTDLEHAALKRFMTRLSEIPDEERKGMVDEARSAQVPITLATAFNLANADRETLTAELRKILVKDIEVRFEQRPELVCGVALEVPGRRLSWSVGSYLEDLSSGINEALSEEANSAHQS